MNSEAVYTDSSTLRRDRPCSEYAELYAVTLYVSGDVAVAQNVSVLQQPAANSPVEAERGEITVVFQP